MREGGREVGGRGRRGDFPVQVHLNIYIYISSAGALEGFWES